MMRFMVYCVLSVPGESGDDLRLRTTPPRSALEDIIFVRSFVR